MRTASNQPSRPRVARQRTSLAGRRLAAARVVWMALLVGITGALGACQSEELGPTRPEGVASSLAAPTALEQRAEQHLLAGEFAEARALYSERIQAERLAFRAWIGLARIAAYEGDQAGFDRSLDAAMRSSPGTPLALAMQARAMLDAAERFPRSRRGPLALTARSFLARARSSSGLEGLPLLFARAEAVLGNEASAERALVAQLREDPRFEEAWLRLARRYRAREDRAAMARLVAVRRELGREMDAAWQAHAQWSGGAPRAPDDRS